MLDLTIINQVPTGGLVAAFTFFCRNSCYQRRKNGICPTTTHYKRSRWCKAIIPVDTDRMGDLNT